MARKKNNKDCPSNKSKSSHNWNNQQMKRIISLIHLFVRMGYTIIAWAVLSIGDMSSPSIFVSLFLFAAPVFMDSFQYCFSSWSRKWIVSLELLTCGSWVLFAFLGLVGVLVVNEYNAVAFANKFIGAQGDIVSTEYLWYYLGSIPFITCVDFACRFAMKKDIKDIQGKGA